MRRKITFGLVLLAATAFAAATVHPLRAEATPPAYIVLEITVTDKDGYTKEFIPAVTKALEGTGSAYIVRGGKAVPFAGAPPAPRVVIVQFEISVDGPPPKSSVCDHVFWAWPNKKNTPKPSKLKKPPAFSPAAVRLGQYAP
jgi:hypothetical protein